MRIHETATIGKHVGGRPEPDNVTSAEPVLAAVWCRSVGASWTLELHRLGPGMAAGEIVDWISSGVPISQPEPDALTHGLLAERGMQLFRDSSADSSTHHRHRIGYVSRDAELIAIAHLLRDAVTGTGMHPLMLAVRWIEAGLCADDAQNSALR